MGLRAWAGAETRPKLWIASTSPRRTCVNADNKILVIGGGMSGLTAALEAAEAGSQVIITEAAPYLGGRVAQLHRYFPKL